MQRVPAKVRLMLFISSKRYGFKGTIIELGARLGFEATLVNKCLTELANEGLVSIETNCETQHRAIKMTRKGKTKILEILFSRYWYIFLGLAMLLDVLALKEQTTLGVPISPGLAVLVIVSLAVLSLLLWWLRATNKNWLQSEELG
jgi:hypothetical protein